MHRSIHASSQLPWGMKTSANGWMHYPPDPPTRPSLEQLAAQLGRHFEPKARRVGQDRSRGSSPPGSETCFAGQGVIACRSPHSHPPHSRLAKPSTPSYVCYAIPTPHTSKQSNPPLQSPHWLDHARVVTRQPSPDPHRHPHTPSPRCQSDPLLLPQLLRPRPIFARARFLLDTMPIPRSFRP